MPDRKLLDLERGTSEGLTYLRIESMWCKSAASHYVEKEIVELCAEISRLFPEYFPRDCADAAALALVNEQAKGRGALVPGADGSGGVSAVGA